MLDATGTARCVFVAHCAIAAGGLLLAADHAERVAGAVFMTPALPLTPAAARADGLSLRRGARRVRGLGEDESALLGAGLPRLPRVLLRAAASRSRTRRSRSRTASRGASRAGRRRSRSRSAAPDLDEATIRELLGRIRCPLLVTQGDEDRLVPPDRGAAFAAATGAELVSYEGVGHCPHARHPVPFNLMLRDFCERAWGRPARRPPWRRAVRRPKRALFVSSPIGLGHAWRDVAIARELRALEPELEIDWLAQDPGHARARALRRADPSRERAARERVAPHRRRVARARAQRLPGVAPDGRDPARQLHALPRRRDRAALRPLDRRRGVGARLLPA